jgi:hypothetical protein
MKLTNFSTALLNQTIKTLIEFNRIFGDKPTFTEINWCIDEYKNKFEIGFFIDYYEDQCNSDEWQTVTILKDETFRKLVKDVQDVIYAYNDVQGFEDEEEYNFHNNDKSEW